MDNNTDGDIDTVHVQGEAVDSNSDAEITYYTGEAATIDAMSVTTETDPNAEVTGYCSTIPSLAPAGAEDSADFNVVNDGDFTFQRQVDGFDGLVEEGLD